jgi:signal transduction histidine kinase
MRPADQTKSVDRAGGSPRIRISGISEKGLSRGTAAVAIFCLMFAIGVLDYFTGFEVSFLVFYFLPVALAVTAFGWRIGVLTAIVSVTVWLAGDFAAGAHYANRLVPWWNATIAFGTYLVLIALLARLLATQREMEERIRQRTVALTDEIAERERLEKVILGISERERRNLGHDLHDGLGQHLTGTSLTGQILVEKLQARNAEEAADATRIVTLIEEAIEQTRRLAKGLVLADIERDGLSAALQELALTSTVQSRVACEFHCDGTPTLDEGTTVHLYRIAQEAVSNALRHANARRIEIALAASGSGLTLTVRDNGAGLPALAAGGRGLGLRIMAHRATIVGASFAIGPAPGGGTLMTCRLPSSPFVS